MENTRCIRVSGPVWTAARHRLYSMSVCCCSPRRRLDLKMSKNCSVSSRAHFSSASELKLCPRE
ncbi:hypothetical protein Mapa_017400 [Marchantia paleacea]|nr:hypothetical protein Mapa_017400 [Marchantia paleacea]